MEYELKCAENKLSINVSARENMSDEDEWRVEARTSRAPDSQMVFAWGPTRADALREVGKTWDDKSVANGLPGFDWEAVAVALNAVRAL